MYKIGPSQNETKIAALLIEHAQLLSLVTGDIKSEVQPADALVKLAVINHRISHLKEDAEDAHAVLRSVLKGEGFTKSSDSSDGEVHTKPAKNGHTISVKLKGGAAHTTLEHNGVIRGYVGTSMTVGGLHGDIENAAEESGETNSVEASEEGRVAAQ